MPLAWCQGWTGGSGRTGSTGSSVFVSRTVGFESLLASARSSSCSLVSGIEPTRLAETEPSWWVTFSRGRKSVPRHWCACAPTTWQ